MCLHVKYMCVVSNIRVKIAPCPINCRKSSTSISQIFHSRYQGLNNRYISNPLSAMFTQKNADVLIRTSSQIRHASGKASKNQTTSMRSSLARFLGPRNYKGFHKSNPFFFPPSNHRPNYISQYPILSSSLEGRKIHWNKVFENGSSGQSFKSGVTPFTPFAGNPNTKTNMVVSQQMKDDIMRDINENNRSAQDVSYKYGLSVPRVEAIVELETIRKKWSDEVCN